jgi:hypothetical protein
MAARAAKPKSAMDTLSASFHGIVSQAKKRMTDAEFKRAEKQFDQIASKVRASRGQRRETA